MQPLRRAIGVTAFMMTVLLTACGGSGGDAAPEPPQPVNRNPVAEAGLAPAATEGVRFTLDGTGSTDPDGDALAYAWTVVAAPIGAGARLEGAGTARPSFVPDAPGRWEFALQVSDGRGGSSRDTVAVDVQPHVPAAIVLSMAEPLAGRVGLSLSGTVSGAVTWFADLRLIGTADAVLGGAISWSTGGVSNGEHQLLAQIATAAGPVLEVKRTVTVANSTIRMGANVRGRTGVILVDVRASAPAGIAQVRATLGGAEIGTLTQPNACRRECDGIPDVYQFRLQATALGTGMHTLEVTATDGAGQMRTLSVAVVVDNVLVLSLAEPADGAFVHGTLRVTGSVGSDKPGPVTTTARLGDVAFLDTQATNFSASLDLTGVAPGAYTLTVRSVDATGQVTQITRTVRVASSASLAPAPVYTLPVGTTVLAAEGSRLLLEQADGQVLFRDLGTGAETLLAGSAEVDNAGGWRMDNGRVVAQGRGTDCVNLCIYLWQSNGQRSNLTLANPYSRTDNVTGGWAADQHPVMAGDHVLWVNDKASATGHYTLHRLSTGSYTKIAAPPGTHYVGNTQYDIVAEGAAVDFWFWAETGGGGMNAPFDVFRWRSDTGATTRLTGGGARHIYPRADAAWVAWRQTPLGGTQDGTFSLVLRPRDADAPTILSTTATDFRLRDGVVAWAEVTAPGSQALRARHGDAVTTLSTEKTAAIAAAGSGWVAFTEPGRLYTWDSLTGTRALRLEALPSRAFVTGSELVFLIDTSVYRVALNPDAAGRRPGPRADPRPRGRGRGPE